MKLLVREQIDKLSMQTLQEYIAELRGLERQVHEAYLGAMAEEAIRLRQEPSLKPGPQSLGVSGIQSGQAFGKV